MRSRAGADHALNVRNVEALDELLDAHKPGELASAESLDHLGRGVLGVAVAGLPKVIPCHLKGPAQFLPVGNIGAEKQRRDGAAEVLLGVLNPLSSRCRR